MNTFDVTIEHSVYFTIPVEANNRHDAGEIAMKLYEESLTPVSDFDGQDQGPWPKYVDKGE